MSDMIHGSDASHDFDFFFGRWRIHNRRLVGRLQGSDAWEDFEATGHCWPLPGGLGNQDEFRTDHWSGFVGMSLRFLDPQSGQWSIYWIDNHINALQPPVVGSFSNGVGLFEGPDMFQGKLILVRFTWSDITTTTARWQQAFSSDVGQTWETNWMMDFTRIRE